MRVTCRIIAHHFLTLVFTCHVNEENREDQLRISTRHKTYGRPPCLKEYKGLTSWQHVQTLTSPWGCTLSSLVRLTPLCTDYTALSEPSLHSSFSLGKDFLPGAQPVMFVSARAHLHHVSQPQTYTDYSIYNIILFGFLKGTDYGSIISVFPYRGE